MGTICIILGILFLLGFTGGGYLLVNFLSEYQMMGQSLLSFLGFSSISKAYIIIVGACFVIGLLFCISYMMIGFTSRRAGSLKRRVEDLEDEVTALKKKVKKTGSSKKSKQIESEDSDQLFDATEDDE